MAQYTRALLVPIDGYSGPLVFDVNPYQVRIHKVNIWAELPAAGREQPYLQFGCGEARRINFAAQLTREDKAADYIKQFMENLLNLMKPTVRGAGLNRPPRVQFILGDHLNITCIIEEARISHGIKHRNRQEAYLAEPWSLLPKHGHVDIRVLEYL